MAETAPSAKEAPTLRLAKNDRLAPLNTLPAQTIRTTLNPRRPFFSEVNSTSRPDTTSQTTQAPKSKLERVRDDVLKRKTVNFGRPRHAAAEHLGGHRLLCLCGRGLPAEKLLLPQADQRQQPVERLGVEGKSATEQEAPEEEKTTHVAMDLVVAWFGVPAGACRVAGLGTRRRRRILGMSDMKHSPKPHPRPLRSGGSILTVGVLLTVLAGCSVQKRTTTRGFHIEQKVARLRVPVAPVSAEIHGLPGCNRMSRPSS